MRPYRTRLIVCLLLVGFAELVGLAVNRAEAQQEIRAGSEPRVIDGWKIESIASSPDLVTPVACVFDAAGGLLVIESHTHFPPDGYKGPKTDRVFRFDDSDGDGTLDRQRLFYEGGVATMGLATLQDDWIAVASRSEVIRIRDADGDGIAEQREVLLRHETPSSYPHNGLGGLVVGPDQLLYVGQGENLGEPYTLTAADDSVQVGGGEGGNVFVITQDGRQLRRFATGFWNPFGLCFDAGDRLWAVGNDPDSMPPCRLLHVVQGGDYGYQFRFGRPGTHPLQAWDGEFPGTLGMAAGTGEAPCAVTQVGDDLWVTSWGSNRVERYRMKPSGATFQGEMDVVVQGGPAFRPVGIAVAKDGSIYISDWVDRSYPVHGKGGLWRISSTVAPNAKATDAGNPVLSRSTDKEKSAIRLVEGSVTRADRMMALKSDDPFVRQAAIAGLERFDQLDQVERTSSMSVQQRVGLITAWRWKELCDPDSVDDVRRREWIQWGLADRDPSVTLAALRWATERRCVEQTETIESLLERDDLTPELLAGTIASLAFLDSDNDKQGAKESTREKWLYDIAADPARASRIRSLALSMLGGQTKKPNADELSRWLQNENGRQFGGQAVRLLVERGGEEDYQLLATVASDETKPVQVRADAIAGLSRKAGPFSALLNKSSIPGQPDPVRIEARRVLKRVRSQGSNVYPALDDVDGWTKLTAAGGDRQAGRRVFFRTTCANCHAHSGRGSKVGPDLTNLSGHMTRQRLVESIIRPSQEVGPLFVTWKVLTVDGKLLTGMKLDRPGKNNALRLLGAEGDTFEIPLADIESQMPVEASIMPTGLEQTMSPEEFRDLIEFLVDPAWTD